MARLLICLVYAASAVASEPRLEWAGRGAYRVLVRVDPAKEVREGNERPAKAVLDFTKLLADAAAGRTPDLAGLQVIRQDPATGRAVHSAKFVFGVGEFDVPWRWYDDEIGYDFPEFDGNLDSTDGKITFTNLPRFGYFDDCVGDWKTGHLALIHRESKELAWYGVYFDLLMHIPGRPQPSL